MKLLITGDWQLDSQPSHDQVDQLTQRSTRFAETVDTIHGVINAGVKAGCTGMLHLGDLTENKNPRTVELEAAAELFRSGMDQGLRLWAIAGNHDGSLFRISGSSFGPLARMVGTQFKVYEEVAVDEELHMLAIPYIHRASLERVHGLIQAALVAYDAGSPKVHNLFAAAHYGIVGAGCGPKNLVLDSDYLGQAQLPTSRLDHIFAGHIHKAQQLEVGPTKAWLPGSPIMCDFGEREDRKTYIIFDTITREVTVHDVPQVRRFVVIDYKPELGLTSNGSTPWKATDHVQLVGTYAKPDYPKATLEAGFKAGLVRPFSLDFQVTQAKSVRAKRELTVSAEGGVRQALQAYVKEKYPNETGNPGEVAPATAAVIELLEEQGRKIYCEEIWPTSVETENFMTLSNGRMEYLHGAACLVTGPNGIGKTNTFDAPYWAYTGKTSKGLGLDGVVHRNKDRAKVTVYLDGTAQGLPRSYRITREVKLAKDLSARQKLSLEQLVDGKWDSMNDGGVEQVQETINALLGGSNISLKITNFKFQRDNGDDRSSFVDYKPKDRKGVISEILGHEPLRKAFKVLDGRRQASVSALNAAKSKLTGMMAAGEGAEARLATMKAEAEEATIQAQLLAEAVTPAEAQVTAAAAGEATARGQVQAKQAELDALPNTQAAVSGAEAALVSHNNAYTAGRAPRAQRYDALKADIAAKEGQLAGLAAPDPAEITKGEAELTQAQAQYEALNKDLGALAMSLNGAKATTTAKTQAAQAAAAASELAEKELDCIPECANVSEESERERLASFEGQLAELEKDVQGLAGTTVKTKAELDQVIKDQTVLDQEKKSLEELGVGDCSRCGQPITAEHIAIELAENADKRAQAQKQKDALGNLLAEGNKQLAEAATKKALAQGYVKGINEALQVLAIQAERLYAAQAKATAAMVTKKAAESEVAAATKAEKELEPKVVELSPKVIEAKNKVAQLGEALAAKKQAGSTIGRLQGELATLRKQHEDNTAAGIAEDEKHQVEVKRLQEAVGKAQVDHITNQAVADALKGQLVALNAQLDQARAASTAAAVDLEGIKGKAKAAVQRCQDLEASAMTLSEQLKAVESSKFELGMLEQRAEIDTRAAELVDPKQGLPVFLIDQSLGFLEDRINTYLEELGASYLRVELTTLAEDKETLAVLVDDGQPGRKLDIANYSGGQLDRLEYAIKWALSDLLRQTRGVTFGQACYDEPSGGLEADGKERMIRMMHQRVAQGFPVTMLISHDERMIRAFDHRIEVKQGPLNETMVAA